MNDFLNIIDYQELFAFAYFLICWAGYNHYTRRENVREKSLLGITNRHRLQWMREMLRRDNRSVDAITIGNLMRSITFTANTTIFIVAGLLGVLTYHKELGTLIAAIPYAKTMTPAAWEMKLLFLIYIFVYAYFKYTWSLRQHNYTSIFVAAAPDHRERLGEHEHIAQKGAFLAGNAAEHFNHGQRAYYFGIAALAWFVHPYLFIATTTIVLYILHRREFRSATLKNLLR